MKTGQLSETTLQQLEFQRTLDCIAKLAVSEPGAASLRNRRPITDLDDIQRDLFEVSELAAFLDDEGEFSPVRVEDLTGLLEHVAVPGSVLDGEELLALGSLLEALRGMADTVARVGGKLPFLERYECDVPPRSLESSIFKAIEKDGNVSDDASPDVSRARNEIRSTRNRLTGLMDRVLKGLPDDDRPTGASVTMRNGRYVMPVLREARSRAKGIVHGESGSGATLFVEPAEAVDLGNRLAEWEAAESRAVIAVLRGLTEQIREHAALIALGWDMCVAIDDLHARARYALQFRASAPEVSPAPAPLRLVDARHPLLLEENIEVVPCSFEMRDSGAAMVVSGPNAGGKTVLLKTAGLAVLLSQSGIVPPLGHGSHIPVFAGVFTDIGDRQSIAQSLSTYSAHLKALREIVELADDSTLVLIDEFGTGTDPSEGAALASAILLDLVGKGTHVVATTHLSPLKELAAENEALVNASLRFNEETLSSTYELIVGVPGRSYGLHIARQLGLPDYLVEKAVELMPSVERDIEALLVDLNSRDAELNRLREELEQQRQQLTSRTEAVSLLETDLAARDAALRAKETALETEGREKARQFLLDARKRVEKAIEAAGKVQTPAQARKARGLVEEGVREQASDIDELARKMAAKGWRVKGAVAQTPAPFRAQKIGSASSTRPETVELDAKTEISLRGLREADAEYEVIQALDAAYTADIGTLRIIHGKGTGALRAMVQRVLSGDGRVKNYQFAPLAEGGAGVTVAEFK